MIDSVFRRGKHYYPQLLLEECKYFVKERKISQNIIYDIEISFDYDRENYGEENSDKENSDEENSDEENSDEEKSDKENFDGEIFVYIKMVNKYYQKHKEKFQKETRERYQNLSEGEKEKRRRKSRERY